MGILLRKYIEYGDNMVMQNTEEGREGGNIDI